MRTGLATAFGLALGLSASAAVAQPAAPAVKIMRLTGAAPSAADPAPKVFVIDVRVTPGDSDPQTTLDGWYASSAGPAASGEVTGSCVQTRCVINAELVNAKLVLTGDFGDAAGPVAARFTVKDEDDKTVQEGAATLTPLAGPVAGLGALAAPDAINEIQLDDLLVWNDQRVSSGSPPSDEPPSGSQRESLAAWQEAKGRLATGLIFTADLTELRADADAARKKAAWTVLGDAVHGWSAGYPAALLPAASRAGTEQHFTSADGKALLVVAVDPPMTSDDFDAFIDKISADRDGRSDVSTVRVNGDLEMSYAEGGVVTAAMYRNRENGLARVVFTYPVAARDAYDPYETIVQHSLVVTDDLKP
ncbi:MAG TPA: hypothetical protein VII42_15605 [Caulobacteraceae bacterium]